MNAHIVRVRLSLVATSVMAPRWLSGILGHVVGVTWMWLVRIQRRLDAIC